MFRINLKKDFVEKKLYWLKKINQPQVIQHYKIFSTKILRSQNFSIKFHFKNFLEVYI